MLINLGGIILFMNQKKSMALGIAAGMMVAGYGFSGYNSACAGNRLAVAGARVSSDSSTLTIEASEDDGGTGRRTVVWQQFDDGEACAMRYIEMQDCPNARRNDGALYSCNGDSYRDFDCDGSVEEHGIKRIGRSTTIVPRTDPRFQPVLIDTEYMNIQREIEQALGVNLEDKVREWREQREVPP